MIVREILCFLNRPSTFRLQVSLISKSNCENSVKKSKSGCSLARFFGLYSEGLYKNSPSLCKKVTNKR